MAFEIRALQSWAEYLECERIQQLVWPSTGAREVVPAHLLVTADKNGGILLAGFRGGEMAGFVFGFIGADRDERGVQFKHCSHMLGVLPRYRGMGLGFALKQRQRERALEQGLGLMTWTFDPLQAVNARLNLTRLGGICRQYIQDAYGEMQDLLNAGISSDRFLVEWHLESSRVRERAGGSGLTRPPIPRDSRLLYEVSFDDKTFPHVESESQPEGSSCVVEIPSDLHKLKLNNLDLAIEWREVTRRTLEHAFASGWIAFEVVDWIDERGRARTGYLLRRDEQGSFPSVI